MRRSAFALLAILLSVFGVPAYPAAQQAPAATAPQTYAPDPARWADDIAAFERADRANPPRKGGIVFVGSSSIRLWTTLAEDFRDLPVLNRGFGGSQLPEVIAYVDRIVLPYEPRQVVVYCGANDIAHGRTPEQVTADFQKLVSLIHAKLPRTEVAFISIAANPARWSQVDRVRAANQTIATWAETQPRVEFIDVFSEMLGPDGLPKPDIFAEDRLHMNRKGYELWRTIIGPRLRR